MLNVEWLFSQLGGTQSVKRCNLAVDTFKTLGKCCANYAYHLYLRAHAAGKPTHRHHGHMHTHPEKNIHIDLTNELKTTFAWVPLSLWKLNTLMIILWGPESISLDEIDAAFEGLGKEKDASWRLNVDGADVLEGEVYSFDELDRIDDNLAPHALEEDISALRGGSNNGGT